MGDGLLQDHSGNRCAASNKHMVPSLVPEAPKVHSAACFSLIRNPRMKRVVGGRGGGAKGRSLRR
eukprot:3856030-Alexandrium_andersonii.AAC.1